ncbi:penicillin-binding protein activator [Shimia sp. FJ5]|uniref:penicillin-binding protein activator n=1 Tax=Shimia sp. FJ5 TaxID=3079054 RepID=UPI00261C78FF|nr:penicillin-binding protein activator [Shimia sp. FJ5]MDV4143277.1 penicillin-binding protein activator [Shimia sp. FJ5]
MLFRSSLARRFLKGAAATLALVGLTACVPSTGPVISTSNPVPVALLVPSGSGDSGDALIAQSLENAARLAISDLDGVKIDLRVYSTAGKPATAAAAAQKAVAEGAKIIVGPLYGAAANAAGKAVAGNGVNVLTFSNNTEIAGGNVFVLGSTFENTANRLVNYATSQGKRNILIVHADTVPGQVGRNAIMGAINASSASSAGTVAYKYSQDGVIAAVAEIKAAVEQNAPDTIFLTASTSGALPLFSQMLPEAGIDPQTVQYIGLTRWDLPSQTVALPGVQGSWFARPDEALSRAYTDRYAQAYGGLPHNLSGLAYDGIAAIGALVKAGKSTALTTSALTQGAGFQGVNGIFRLRSDGTNERGLAVVTIRDKQVVTLDPAPKSFGGFGF